MESLVDALTRYTDARSGEGAFPTAIDGLILLRSNREKRPGHLLFRPSLCIVVQGAKWAVFGDRHLDYRAGQALVISVEIPAFGRVAEASPDKPYLGIIVGFDLALMREVMEELAEPPTPSGEVGSGVWVSDFDGPLADCTGRLVRLLDTPQAIPILRPLILREMYYWLLTGPHGGEVARIALAGSHAESVISAIHTLRDRFAEPIRIEDLAEIAHMSLSAFHRQFKAVTSTTPLQYQKQLRLLEARRLMATEAANAEMAAFQVGYESASQFSREYARMFGAPPRRDIVRMRSLPVTERMAPA